MWWEAPRGAKAAKARRLELARRAALETAEKFKGMLVKIRIQAGADGKFYGSVTNKDVADALAEQYGIEIDKRKIVLDSPIKAYGTYPVDVKLYPEIAGTLNVLVYGG